MNTGMEKSNLFSCDMREVKMYAVVINSHRLLNIGLDQLREYCQYGSKILHDASLQFNVDRQTLFADLDMDDRQEIAISGKIVTPVKMTLTKSSFEQILATLNNLTPDNNEFNGNKLYSIY